MCSTDFEHHIEGDRYGCSIYPSETACREGKYCTSPEHQYHCGIVKVRVEMLEIVQESENG